MKTFFVLASVAAVTALSAIGCAAEAPPDEDRGSTTSRQVSVVVKDGEVVDAPEYDAKLTEARGAALQCLEQTKPEGWFNTDEELEESFDAAVQCCNDMFHRKASALPDATTLEECRGYIGRIRPCLLGKEDKCPDPVAFK